MIGCVLGVHVVSSEMSLPCVEMYWNPGAVSFVNRYHTVWNENFTWNLILRFYGWWQNRKFKIRKLYANLMYIITRSRKKLGFRKIKIPTTFCRNDSEASRKI